MTCDSLADRQITNPGQEANWQLVAQGSAAATRPHCTQYGPAYYAKVETDPALLQMRMNSPAPARVRHFSRRHLPRRITCSTTSGPGCRTEKTGSTCCEGSARHQRASSAIARRTTLST